MGKKEAQKTKRHSVAMAEASATGDERGQQQSQSQTPRKRGRPRKMVETTEGKEKKEEAVEQPEASMAAEEGEGDEGSESFLKNVKSSEEEGVSHAQQKQLPRGEPPTSRRARRKSKPTKST